MPRVTPLDREDLKDFDEVFALVEQFMGFVPNSMLTMGRNPALLQGFMALAGAVNAPGKVSPELKALISYVVSRSAGCRYCQAHTAHGAAHRAGIPPAKLEAVWEYETSPAFSDAERAALRVAQAAGPVPNGVTDADFADLHQYYSEDEIVEIVAVISLFGFLNRWNDTMATELEASPRSWAEQALAKDKWAVGKHAAQ